LAVPERVSAPVKSLAWFESLLRDAPREAKIART
jgi:hypothetical protein